MNQPRAAAADPQSADSGRGIASCRVPVLRPKQPGRFGGGNAGRYQPIIRAAAQRHRVDPAIVQAIIMAESGFNPRAVSKRGARGLMQLMPATAKSLGVRDLFNPEHNINAGVRYYRQLLNQFKGDVRLALAAYNAGSRKVRQYKGIPPFETTRRYVRKVLQYYRHYRLLLDTNNRDA